MTKAQDRKPVSPEEAKAMMERQWREGGLVNIHGKAKWATPGKPNTSGWALGDVKKEPEE